MMTLDEVIDNFEKACDLERRCENCSGCLGQENGCPNDGAECVPDALYYLKELRHILDNTVWVESTKEENGYWKLPTLPETGNDPLTWDELKGMEGKPVWATFDNENGTWYIAKVYDDEVVLYEWGQEFGVRISGTWDYTPKRWQAYRKEKK